MLLFLFQFVSQTCGVSHGLLGALLGVAQFIVHLIKVGLNTTPKVRRPENYNNPDILASHFHTIYKQLLRSLEKKNVEYDFNAPAWPGCRPPAFSSELGRKWPGQKAR